MNAENERQRILTIYQIALCALWRVCNFEM